jgi:hypothetical protein
MCGRGISEGFEDMRYVVIGACADCGEPVSALEGITPQKPFYVCMCQTIRLLDMVETTSDTTSFFCGSKHLACSETSGSVVRVRGVDALTQLRRNLQGVGGEPTR